MTKVDENIQTAQNMLSGIVERCYELEEENKVIKEEKEMLIRQNTLLQESNKKLNEEIENHKQNIMQDELEIIPKLEEENKKLKAELEKLKSTYVYDAKQVRDIC